MANKRQCIADSREKGYFEEQREILLTDIALSFEHVLGNINKLNRSLEEVIKMGNDFSSVEALWSQFENVMGSNDDKAASQQQQQQQQQQQGEKAEKSEEGG